MDTNTKDVTTDAFCNPNSMPMVMYMGGFRFTLGRGGYIDSSPPPPCLNLYLVGWTLDTEGKFVAAMFGVLVLAVIVEGVSKARQVFARHARDAGGGMDSKQTEQQSTGVSSLFWRSPFAVSAASSAIHGVQALLGYVLMLATMTFSAELLLMTVAGLSIGHGVFFRRRDAGGGVPKGHVNSNP